MIKSNKLSKIKKKKKKNSISNHNKRQCINPFSELDDDFGLKILPNRCASCLRDPKCEEIYG